MAPLVPYPSTVLGYVVYEALVIFTVDLEKGQVVSVEVCADDMTHVDTGLDQAAPRDWRRLHAEARALVEQQPKGAQPHWAE